MTLGVGSADVYRNSRWSEMLTRARTADVQSLARAVTMDVGSADVRLQCRRLALRRIVLLVKVRSPEICVGSADVDLNG
jgi:hypothetical protein